MVDSSSSMKVQRRENLTLSMNMKFSYIFRPWKPYKSGRKIKIEEERICLMWHSANVYDFVWCVCMKLRICTLHAVSTVSFESFQFCEMTFHMFHNPTSTRNMNMRHNYNLLGMSAFPLTCLLSIEMSLVQRKFSADSWMLMNVR